MLLGILFVIVGLKEANSNMILWGLVLTAAFYSLYHWDTYHSGSGSVNTTPSDTDFYCGGDISSSQPKKETHAEWVERDAERLRKVYELEEQGWAEDYMDEHDW